MLKKSTPKYNAIFAINVWVFVVMFSQKERKNSVNYNWKRKNRFAAGQGVQVMSG